MSYRSDRFNNSMRSLETMIGDRDASKLSFLSDHGAGVERMIDEIDARLQRERDLVVGESCSGRKEDKELNHHSTTTTNNYNSNSSLQLSTSTQSRETLLRRAIKKLYRLKKKHLIPTLLKIVENGSNREESIWQMLKD